MSLDNLDAFTRKSDINRTKDLTQGEKSQVQQTKVVSSEIMEKIRNLRLTDDLFFSVVMQDSSAFEEVVNTIIPGKGFKIKRSDAQITIKNISGHEVRLDSYAVDNLGRNVNIEMQIAESDDIIRRSRYYGGSIDTFKFPKGAKYRDLKDTYVIFITSYDVGGNNSLLYYTKKYLFDLNNDASSLDDGFYQYYLYLDGNLGSNNAYTFTDTLRLQRLAQLMKAKDYMQYSTDFPGLTKRVQYFKEDKKGVVNMGSVFEDYAREREEKVRREVTREVMRKDITIYVNSLRKLKCQDDKIISMLQEEYKLSKEEAESFVYSLV